MKNTEIDLGLTHLEIGDGYVVARTRAGMDVGVAEHNFVMDTVEKHTDLPIVLVLDEVNSYSVKLETLLLLRVDERISHCGVVSYRHQTRIVHTLGSKMARRPVSFFSSRHDAILWAESLRTKEDGLVQETD